VKELQTKPDFPLCHAAAVSCTQLNVVDVRYLENAANVTWPAWMESWVIYLAQLHSNSPTTHMRNLFCDPVESTVLNNITQWIFDTWIIESTINEMVELTVSETVLHRRLDFALMRLPAHLCDHGFYLTKICCEDLVNRRWSCNDQGGYHDGNLKEVREISVKYQLETLRGPGPPLRAYHLCVLLSYSVSGW